MKKADGLAHPLFQPARRNSLRRYVVKLLSADQGGEGGLTSGLSPVKRQELMTGKITPT